MHARTPPVASADLRGARARDRLRRRPLARSLLSWATSRSPPQTDAKRRAAAPGRAHYGDSVNADKFSSGVEPIDDGRGCGMERSIAGAGQRQWETECTRGTIGRHPAGRAVWYVSDGWGRPDRDRQRRVHAAQMVPYVDSVTSHAVAPLLCKPLGANDAAEAQGGTKTITRWTCGRAFIWRYLNVGNLLSTCCASSREAALYPRGAACRRSRRRVLATLPTRRRA